jgi:hypothetical protein
MKGSRLESQKALVQRMAKIATKLVPDGTGVKLGFVNTDVERDDLDEAGIQDVMNTIRLSKGTQIGTRLKDKVLQPLIYDKLDRDETLKRPYLVLIFTDGHPTLEADDTFRDNVVECMRRVSNAYYEPEGVRFSPIQRLHFRSIANSLTKAVRFCLSQVGDDKRAKEFLTKLKEDRGLKRVLYCTTGE